MDENTQVTMTERQVRKVLDQVQPSGSVKLTFHAATTNVEHLYAFRAPWVQKRMAMTMEGIQHLAELIGAMVSRKVETVADLPAEYQSRLTFEVTPFAGFDHESFVALAPHIIDMQVS